MKIKNEFSPYEQALDLKELGFDEPCLLQIQYTSGSDIYSGKKFKNSIWLCNGEPAEINDKKIKYKFPKHSEQGYGTLQIPTFSQAFRWFREKYGLYSHVRESYAFDNTLEFVTQINGSYVNHGIEDKPFNRFESYEEAELKCLKKLIEIVKEK